ncbi:hypothetical protein COY95_03590, partial [Candidatus Woesearchaeota archaeon CG_4_10_14_0_8_um_filter_47_5]
MNSTFSEEWNYSAGSQVYDLAVGDVGTSVPGNEVLVGSRLKAVLLNSTGGVLWSRNDWTRSVKIAPLGEYVKAYYGTNGGILYECDHTTCVAQYSAGSAIIDLQIGNLTRDPYNEILLVLQNKKIVVLDSSFSVINNHTYAYLLSEAAIGEFDTAPGGDALVVFQNSKVNKMSFQDPLNLRVDIGSTPNVWNHTGKLTSGIVESSQAITALNQYLESCSTPICLVPINITGESFSALNLREPYVYFRYNATQSIDATDNAFIWEKTNNIRVGESLEYVALNISYPSNPQLPLYVRSIMKDQPFLTGSENYVFNRRACTAIGSVADLGYTLPNGTSVGCDRDYY